MTSTLAPTIFWCTPKDRTIRSWFFAEQVNAVGIPGSQLRKYSFIGDLPGRDRSNAWFYIDDIAITNDIPVSETPFVAPGRRMLFVDMYDRYVARLYEKPGCAPVLAYEDFGLSSTDLSELAAVCRSSRTPSRH